MQMKGKMKDFFSPQKRSLFAYHYISDWRNKDTASPNLMPYLIQLVTHSFKLSFKDLKLQSAMPVKVLFQSKDFFEGRID